jgi:hypothetical protein
MGLAVFVAFTVPATAAPLAASTPRSQATGATSWTVDLAQPGVDEVNVAHSGGSLQILNTNADSFRSGRSYALDQLPPRTLAETVNQIAGTVVEQVPDEATVSIGIRTQLANGQWSAWRLLPPDRPLALEEPTTSVQAEIILWSSPTDQSPEVSGLSLTASTAQVSPSPAAAAAPTYSNPLWDVAGLTPERIDQGVDYSGAGPVYAMGAGIVENVYNTGWPNGVFIAYELTAAGPAQGDVVYVAEDITPLVSVGEAVTAATQIGTEFEGPDGIETGWADPNALGQSIALAYGQWDGTDSTAFGVNFSQLLGALGAPPGIVEGTVQGSLPGGWPTWTANASSAFPSSYAVGAEGTDGALWVQTPQLSAGWQSLGGQIIAAPAVAAVPQASGLASPLFIATGTDHSLWIRSLSEGWTSLVPGLFTYCLDNPAAVVTGSATSPVLTVACEGGDHRLYAATVPVPSSGLPSVRSWTTLGGVLNGGPAVAPVNGVITYFVTAGFNNGQVWITTNGADWQGTAWNCIGHPAAGIAQGSTTTWFGCEGGDGELWAGPAWNGVSGQGGAIEPGAALGITSGADFMFAEASFGTNSVWFRTTSANWASLSGGVLNGVGAVGLN